MGCQELEYFFCAPEAPYPIKPEEVPEHVREIDKNGDGVISFSELSAMMRAVSTPKEKEKGEPPPSPRHGRQPMTPRSMRASTVLEYRTKILQQKLLMLELGNERNHEKEQKKQRKNQKKEKKKE